MNKILMLQVNLQGNVQKYRLGDKIDPTGQFSGKFPTERVITDIRDTSFSQPNEFGEEIYHERYSVYVNGELYQVLQGMATITEYDIEFSKRLAEIDLTNE